MFFKCKSSDFLFKQKQHLGINSGTWVLGGYRYASWIFLPLFFFKGLMSIPEFIPTPAGASALVDRGGGQPASLVRLGNAKQRCLFHLPGLAFLIRGKSRYRERNRQKHNQRQPELLGTTLLILFPGKDKSLMESESTNGEGNCQKKGMMDSSHLKPSNNSLTCSNLSWAPLSSMHSSLKKTPHPHHKKTTLKCFLVHIVHLA